MKCIKPNHHICNDGCRVECGYRVVGGTEPVISPLDDMVSLRFVEKPPAQAGWYWWKHLGVPEVVHVFLRPGHKYLAVQYGAGPGHKREFIPVTELSGEWAGLIKIPAG